jgi:hypothetical protein
MFAKKTVLSLTAGLLLASALPALANHDGWQHRRFDERRGFVVHRPAYGYSAPVYAPQPVYGYGQPAYVPAPYYAGHDNAMATIGGAAVGAFIGSQVGGYGSDRAAAVAAGALIGGIIGSNF